MAHSLHEGIFIAQIFHIEEAKIEPRELRTHLLYLNKLVFGSHTVLVEGLKEGALSRPSVPKHNQV
jgi:hypothetical protein